jgi:transposase
MESFINNDNRSFLLYLSTQHQHQLEPWSYLRDILCLLPDWPVHQLLELAPAYWSKTAAREDVKA